MNAAALRNLRFHFMVFIKSLPQFAIVMVVLPLYYMLLDIPFSFSFLVLGITLLWPIFVLLQNGNLLLGSILSYSLSRKNFLIGVHGQSIFYAALAVIIWFLASILDKSFTYGQPIWILACFSLCMLLAQIGFFYGLIMQVWGKLGFAIYMITFMLCMIGGPITFFVFFRRGAIILDLSALALWLVPISLGLYLVLSLLNSFLVYRKVELKS